MINGTGGRFPILGLVFALALGVAPSTAHPMGNFSINHYSKITVTETSVEIRYLIDMAEIPTFQEMREFDVKPLANDPSVSAYLAKRAQVLKAGLSLQTDGKSLFLELKKSHLQFSDGAGGLPTMKITLVLGARGGAVPGVSKLAYVDNNFPGRAGWKEIVAVGNGVAMLDSSAPATDRSQELTIYSNDALSIPPQQLSADLTYRIMPRSLAGNVPHLSVPAPRKPDTKRELTQNISQTSVSRGASQSRNAASPVAPPLSVSHPPKTPRSRFTELISSRNELSFWVLVTAALIAAGLGALHALEPGHGKTIVAAYLVGSRGTAKHAVLLGLVVTAAHTAGVYLLGVVTLYASRYIVPEQLYPWLGAISGLSVAGLGIFVLIRHLTGETGEHSHASGKGHSHGFLSMFKSAAPNGLPADSGQSKPTGQSLKLRELCMLGITGGIVPCPAALVVLLSGFSLHRVGFGLFLITAFSLGLATVLVAVGLLMVYARRAVSSRLPASGAVLRYLPFLSSAFIVVLGVGIAVSAMASVQIWNALPSTDKLVPFATVILLGLFLGMRHSTDPDHVVAVSTIVSRQGNVRSSALIGLLWGLGHTLTIFLVGSAIIVFGVVIPPRLGLGMEFCVAVMLILLGAINLTGVMKWVAVRMSRLKTIFVPAPQSTLDEHQYSAAGRGSLLFGRAIGRLGLYQTIRPLAVGIVHGLAGSAAVALLVLSTIKSPLWSTAYLVVFGLGTMVGMMLMTAAMSLPLIYTGKRFLKLNRYFIATSGVASIAFGLFLVYQIGFVEGLFSSHVHWIPQ